MKSKKNKFLLLILVVVFLVIYFISRSVKIRKVVCLSCTKNIQFDLQKFSNKKDIEKYLKNNLYIRSYEIRYQIPDIYIIEAQINNPRYAIYNNSLTKFYLVDGNGTVIDIANSTSLPSVSIQSISLNKGDKVSDNNLFSLKIIEKVNYLYSVKSASLDENQQFITFNLSGGVKVLMPIQGDVDYLIGSLRVIYSRLNDDEKNSKIKQMREIDLRFKNPVVR